jgi:DNA-binding MarR family transcriptional regulator
VTKLKAESVEDVDALVGLCEATMRAMGRVRGTPEMEALAAQLSLAQGRCMWNVALHPHCTLSELSEHLNISASTASTQVEELVRLDLVERAPDANDRRAVRISLSPRGQELFERQRQRKRAHLDERLQRLTAAERREMLEALRVLSTLFAKMDGDEADGGEAESDKAESGESETSQP